MHRSWVIYEGQYSCKLNYIGETKWNSAIRGKEHTDPAGNLEPTKWLNGSKRSEDLYGRLKGVLKVLKVFTKQQAHGGRGFAIVI